MNNYIDYSAPPFDKRYNGSLADYNYFNVEYGNLLAFLKQVTHKETIYLMDNLFNDDVLPPDGYNTYIVCAFGEYINILLLQRIACAFADRKLILLTTMEVKNILPQYSIFKIEHLHTLVPHFNKGGDFPLISNRKYTNSILTRRLTKYKKLFTEIAKTKCKNLIFSDGIDKQIDNYDQWSLLSSAYLDTKFHWANETMFESNRFCKCYLTEKTFKPIASKTPFAILGQQGAHNKLSSYGFQTYQHLLGVEWDLLDDKQRVDAISSAMELVTEELIMNNISEFQQIADYNYDYFLNKFYNYITEQNKPITELLLQELNEK